MRLIIGLTAACALLVGCNKTAETTVAANDAMVSNDAMATNEATVATPSAASMAVDGKPDAGTYDVTGPDGIAIKQTISADGTIVNVKAGKTVKGTWTKKGVSTYCMTMEGEVAAKCYTDKMDGTTWRSTNDNDPKDTATIVRIS